jgi:hypothetical protein
MSWLEQVKEAHFYSPISVSTTAITLLASEIESAIGIKTYVHHVLTSDDAYIILSTPSFIRKFSLPWNIYDPPIDSEVLVDFFEVTFKIFAKSTNIAGPARCEQIVADLKTFFENSFDFKTTGLSIVYRDFDWGSIPDAISEIEPIYFFKNCFAKFLLVYHKVLLGDVHRLDKLNISASLSRYKEEEVPPEEILGSFRVTIKD